MCKPCDSNEKVACFLIFQAFSLLIQKKNRTFAPPEPAKPLNDAQMCGSFYLLYNEQQNSI